MKDRERIDNAVKALGLGRQKFLSEAGLAKGFFGSDAGVRVATIVAIKRKYPQVSLDYLIMGQGRPLLSKRSAESPTRRQIRDLER